MVHNGLDNDEILYNYNPAINRVNSYTTYIMLCQSYLAKYQQVYRDQGKVSQCSLYSALSAKAAITPLTSQPPTINLFLCTWLAIINSIYTDSCSITSCTNVNTLLTKGE